MQIKQTTRDKLKTAIETRDYRRINAIVDHLRFNRGMNYHTTLNLVVELTGLEPGDWDEILYECDGLYSQPA
jgi:hypothetical protein